MEQKQNEASGSGSRVWTIPNLLSLFRIGLIPVIIWLYWGEGEHMLAAGVLLLSGATDVADGFIARRFHMTSSLGKVLDPVADKLTQVAMLSCLLPRSPWMAVPIALMVAKELYMSVSGLLVIKRTGIVFGAEWHGKAATCLLYAAILLHMCWPEIPAPVSGLSIGACAVMIGASFALYAVRNEKALGRGKHEQGCM